MRHVVRLKEGFIKDEQYNLSRCDTVPSSLADDGVYIQIVSPSWPVSVGKSAGRPLSIPKIGVIVAPFGI